MKAIKCEICGSGDFVKENGFFVCQSCGTKYSSEEAKKMIIEGTVNVEGTVKIDNSDRIKNYLVIAENSYEADNKEEAVNYCNKILEEDPTNYKAWILKGKSVGWQSTLGNMRIEETIQAFKKAIENAPKEELKDVKEETAGEIKELCKHLSLMKCEDYAIEPSEESVGYLIDYILEIDEIAETFMIKCGVDIKEINKIFAENMTEAAIKAYKNEILTEYKMEEHPIEYTWNDYVDKTRGAIRILEFAINLDKEDNEEDINRYKMLIEMTKDLEESKSYQYLESKNCYIIGRRFSRKDKTELIDQIMTYHQKIKDLDSNYVIPNRPIRSGCYIATAVYGSYDCPEVWTLRRFRDNTLNATWYGRIFIKTYYAVSPTIVKLFGNKKWFNKLFRTKLNKLVYKLQSKGVESTPYNDKY